MDESFRYRTLAELNKQYDAIAARKLQHDIFEISQPYTRLICEIYNRSTFTVQMVPGRIPTLIYPARTEALVEEIKKMLEAAISSHIRRVRKGSASNPLRAEC